MRKSRILKVLSAIFVLGAIYWFGLRSDPKVDALNQALHNSSSLELRNFPYEFKVVRLDGETAVISLFDSGSLLKLEH